MLRNYNADNQAATNLPNNAETVICQLDGVNQGQPSNPIALQGVANVLGGAASTNVVLRIRRGTTVGGTLIGQPASTPNVAQSTDCVVAGTDTSANEIANGSYVLTAQVQGGAAAGTVQGAHLSASVA